MCVKDITDIVQHKQHIVGCSDYLALDWEWTSV